MKTRVLFLFMTILYADMLFGSVRDTVIVGNGTRYEGQYPSGEGVLYSDSLGIYIGYFERGIPNGVCTCVEDIFRTLYCCPQNMLRLVPRLLPSRK